MKDPAETDPAETNETLFFLDTNPITSLLGAGFLGWPAKEVLKSLKTRLIEIKRNEDGMADSASLEESVDKELEETFQLLNEPLSVKQSSCIPPIPIEIPGSSDEPPNPQIQRPFKPKVIEVSSSSEEEKPNPLLRLIEEAKKHEGYEDLRKTMLLYLVAKHEGAKTQKVHKCACAQNLWFLFHSSSDIFSFLSSKETIIDTLKKLCPSASNSVFSFIKDISLEIIQLTLQETYAWKVEKRLFELSLTHGEAIITQASLSEWKMLRWDSNSCAIDASTALIPSVLRYCSKENLFPKNSVISSHAAKVGTLLHFCDDTRTSNDVRMVLLDLMRYKGTKLAWEWTNCASQGFLPIDGVFLDLFRFSFSRDIFIGMFDIIKGSTEEKCTQIGEWIFKNLPKTKGGVYCYVLQETVFPTEKDTSEFIKLLETSWKSKQDHYDVELLGIVSSNPHKNHFLSFLKIEEVYYFYDGMQNNGKLQVSSINGAFGSSERQMIIPGCKLVFGIVDTKPTEI